MEEWRRAAENVERGEVHAVANESRVVHKVTIEKLVSIDLLFSPQCHLQVRTGGST